MTVRTGWSFEVKVRGMYLLIRRSCCGVSCRGYYWCSARGFASGFIPGSFNLTRPLLLSSLQSRTGATFASWKRWKSAVFAEELDFVSRLATKIRKTCAQKSMMHSWEGKAAKTGVAQTKDVGDAAVEDAIKHVERSSRVAFLGCRLDTTRRESHVACSLTLNGSWKYQAFYFM
jgi:hypothetical protein